MAEIKQIQVNGTNYNIYSPEVYSTDEIEVGTWIDGRTIYRKVFTSSASANKGGQISITNALTNLNVDILIRLDGTVNFDNSSARITPLNSIAVRTQVYDNNIVADNIQYDKISNLTVVIEYVKTVSN